VDEEIELEALKVDPKVEENQKQKLAELRKSRDVEKVNILLSELESAARGDDSLMPLFITCAENDVTLGEICNVLRDVWGQYRPPTFI
jgi:methylmalonyl-CoA mutase N-terminal domain/subunit